MKLLSILSAFILFNSTSCSNSGKLNLTDIDSVELIQVDHPYLGNRVNRWKLDAKLTESFLNDFENKTEEVVKFYSCYVIKVHLKNDSLISYRTNGHALEKFKDYRTKGIYFSIDNNINLVTKYWGIPEDKFCKE